MNRVLGIIVLWPLAGLILTLTMADEGTVAATDMDIVALFMHPIGFVGGLLWMAMAMTIVGLEQAALFFALYDQRRGLHPSAFISNWLAIRQSSTLIRLAVRLIARALLIAVPFLVVGGLSAWLLLSKYDINFYLSQRPAEYWMAIAIGTLLCAAMLSVAVPKALGWTCVLPLLFADQIDSANAIRRSRELVSGHRWQVLSAWISWLGFVVLIGFLHSVIVWFVARAVVPLAGQKLSVLVPVLGTCFTLWFGGQLVLSLLQSISLTVVFAGLHEKLLDQATKQLDRRPIRPALPTDRVAADSKNVRSSIGSRHQATLAVAILLLISLAAGLWLLSTVREDDPVLVIAHRGASAAAPENTLAAVQRAIDDKADVVEIDVQETADGEVVVFHDSDFMRLSGVRSKLWEVTMSELASIDVGSHLGSNFNGERVPKLADVLALCKDRVMVDIELKYYGHSQQLEERVATIVEATGMQSQVMMMSLERTGVETMKSIRPEWRVGLLAAVGVGDVTKLPADFLAVSTRLASRDLLQRSHRDDRPVYVWTVDDPRQMARYLSLGFDGIITNRPDIARQVVDNRTELSIAERMLVDLAVRVGVVVNPPIE